MDKPLVIYHANCWDGFCAAWVARRKFGEIEAFAAHYGQSPPNCTNRTVFIVDFSYKRDVMRQILSQAKAATVLDHHKTAPAELAGLSDEFVQRPDLIQNPEGSELPSIWFDMTKSGGRLAWEWWFGPKVPSPWLVDYTEDRDLWRHALVESENINAALRSYPLDFDLWDEFDRSVGQREMFKREGAAIRRAEKAIVNSHVRNARERIIDGHAVLSVNATVLFSEIAGELAKDRPFGACYFDRQDGKRQWSLRSRDGGLDVSEIAKAHGGGGHPQAAGYEEVL